LSKKISVIIAIILGIVAISAPIVISLHFARQQSFNEQMRKAVALAEDVLRRSEEASDQVDAAIRTLKEANAADPCSNENVRLMARIDISSPHLQAVGYIKDNRLMCSSLGLHGEGTPVGPPDYLSTAGMHIRLSVGFPLAPGVKFLLSTDAGTGYSVLLHRDVVIDVSGAAPDMSLGLYGYASKTMLLGKGTFDPNWAAAPGNGYEAELVDKGNLVAIRRSHKWDYASFAAVPMVNVDEGVGRLAWVLLPIGIGAGILLALTVLYVAKLQLALPAVLKTALKRNEFFLQYQPIVDLQTGKWVGAEALVRWRRAGNEVVRPDLFIPVAEESGLIQRITERVIELVARDAAGLFKRYPGFHIAINLSSSDMSSSRTVELLKSLARETGAGPGNLLVEATERGFMKADEARNIVRQLRTSGMHVAIDDFGTGYSSLSYLETFEIDYLKIDKTFVDTIGTDAPTSQVVQHIIEMAKDLKLEMIAEGVETEAQAQFLRNRGVRYAQGWLFARPMAFADLAGALTEKHAA
jgi:sensor c-di-GMP phosphodiesterase-like protein